MKNKICLLLCVLLLLSCVPRLAGCSAAEQSPEAPVVEPSPAAGEAVPAAEQSPGPTYPGPPDSKSGLRRTEEQMEAMKDYLTAHQAEMEEIVAVMMEYSSRETENEYTTFWYSVKWQKLHQSHTVIKEGVHGPGPREVGVFTEHPIITMIRALGEEPVFDFAVTDFSHRIVDNDICSFFRYVDDDDDVPYCRVYLFYCEEEPVENAYFTIYPVIPHWYLYIEELE